MDFISVIIPAFNAERWIERTLDSVAAAIDSECEVIIVNDGSTDNTADIARNYVDRDPRFSLINIDHVGPCAARKAGFLESQGDYIMFVDSDDILPENSISEQRRLLDDYVNIKDEDASRKTDGRPKIVIANTWIRSGSDDRLLISGERRALTGWEYVFEILNRSLPGFLAGHLYARELAESIDWDDSPEITHQENFYLLFSFAMKLHEWSPQKKQVLVDPSVIGYKYIRRAGSQSALMALTPKGLERVWRHINNLGLPEPELTLWGMEVLNRVFIERGIPFATNYSVAADLRHRGKALGENLPEKYVPIVEALGSLKKRTNIARKLARSAGLTSIRPHLSVLLICKHNISKVKRSVASVFSMGFRNLETVIVAIDATQPERIALNELAIQYARVRIVYAEADMDPYSAAVMGLNAAKGLSITYVRPGDLCSAAGLYEAVTRIDYGADAVMPNYRDYHPLTHIRGPIHSYSYLRSTDESRNAVRTAADRSENITPTVIRLLDSDDSKGKDRFFIYGIVWRTDFLRETQPKKEDFTNIANETVSRAFIRYYLQRPIRIVTQDRTSPPAFEYANSKFFVTLLKKLLPWGRKTPFVPPTYTF